MLPLFLILGILAAGACIWSAIESRKPRETVGAGMPPPTGLESTAPEDAMRDALLTSGRVRPKEWEAIRREVFFVHDGLTDEELARLFLGVTGEDVPIPFDLSVDSEEETTPRERFRSALRAHVETGDVESLGSHFAPGPFDAYRVRKRG